MIGKEDGAACALPRVCTIRPRLDNSLKGTTEIARQIRVILHADCPNFLSIPVADRLFAFTSYFVNINEKIDTSRDKLIPYHNDNSYQSSSLYLDITQFILGSVFLALEALCPMTIGDQRTRPAYIESLMAYLQHTGRFVYR